MRYSIDTAKQWFKRNIPAPVLRPVLSWRSRRIARRWRIGKTQDVFTDIFRTNHWASCESVSGHGSEEETTSNIRAALPRIIRDYKIGSMLDAPCGDFNWMQGVDLGGTRSIGGEIVKPLIESVGKRYTNPRRSFIHLDITCGVIPEVDLVFCRDCFIHLPFNLIMSALMTFRNSSAKFLLTSTYQNWPLNYDTDIGGVRDVDLCAWPFNLPPPLELIQEEAPRENKPLKCMGLWSIQALSAVTFE